MPTHSAKFGVAAMLTTALNVGVNMRTQSGQYLRGDEANLLARVPGFTVVDARARSESRAACRWWVRYRTSSLPTTTPSACSVTPHCLAKNFVDDPQVLQSRIAARRMDRAGDAILDETGQSTVDSNEPKTPTADRRHASACYCPNLGLTMLASVEPN